MYGSDEEYKRDWEALRSLVQKRSFEFGDFVLTSGKRSTYYFDGKQVTLYPEGAWLLAKIILHKIKGLDVDAVGGITIGADPIVGAMAVASYLYGNRDLKLFIVRKAPKAHGKGRAIEGPPLVPGDRAVVVDDVITTGGSIIEAIEAVRGAGCQVVKVVALVDRREGGTERIAAMGIDVDPVFDISHFLGDGTQGK